MMFHTITSVSLYLGYKVHSVLTEICIITPLLQGKLAAVNNLLCQQDHFCALCNWGPPFSLTPTSQYLFNIRNENTLLSTNSITDNNATYCPSQYGHYSISITATNNAGLGDVSHMIINIMPTGISNVYGFIFIVFIIIIVNVIKNYTAYLVMLADGNWSINYIIEV